MKKISVISDIAREANVIYYTQTDAALESWGSIVDSPYILEWLGTFDWCRYNTVWEVTVTNILNAIQNKIMTAQASVGEYVQSFYRHMQTWHALWCPGLVQW